ncbi:restriction endonuclease [Cognatilysobacter segetis]|uniref:restriction endonuclease n=1 Tax=Cognatilysobacter segetis TaxID=2492394 RepID=UPI001060DECE|nr:restriction endonuclease [Lysobacter segetis]
MTPAAALATGLAIALVAAIAWLAYIWKVREARFQVEEGLRILSGMRWRELSNLVVDALALSGFERETPEQQAERGAGDVHVYRDGRPWVLTCRQGLAHVITRPAAEEFLRAVRVGHAAGGVLVTPGRAEPAAREVAPNIEVLDGESLWKLVGPLLPPSVHTEIAAHARARALRASGTALATATLGGIAVGYALTRLAVVEDPSPAAIAQAPIAASAPARATVANAAPAPVAPMSEDEEREAIVREIARLPGVDKALWSTRSTLQVFLDDAAVADDAALCSVMKRYELLRASRLQLQSPGTRPVRFMQCAVY